MASKFVSDVYANETNSRTSNQTIATRPRAFSGTYTTPGDATGKIRTTWVGAILYTFPSSHSIASCLRSKNPDQYSSSLHPNLGPRVSRKCRFRARFNCLASVINTPHKSMIVLIAVKRSPAMIRAPGPYPDFDCYPVGGIRQS